MIAKFNLICKTLGQLCLQSLGLNFLGGASERQIDLVEVLVCFLIQHSVLLLYSNVEMVDAFLVIGCVILKTTV